MKLIYPFLLLSFILLHACGKSAPCKNGEVATIRDFTGLDGCGWVVVLNDSENLEPTNLHAFGLELEDGMKVKVKYHETDGASVCMVGKIVEIECIAEL